MVRVRPAVRALLIATVAALWALVPSVAQAADGPKIYGAVTAPDGKPVAGVAISATVHGTQLSTTTGPDGAFEILLPETGLVDLAIDTTTLPNGLSLAKVGDDKRTLTVISDKRLIVKLTAGTPTQAPTPGVSAPAAPNAPPANEGSPMLGQVAQLTVDGILLGIVIALGALGLNLIFGTTGLTNFSHGELLTLGAFTALVLNRLGITIVVAAPIAIVISAFLFGWVQNRVLWRPLRKRRTGLIPSMIVTIGLAIVLRYSILLVFGGDSQRYLQFAAQQGLQIGPVSITPKAAILAVCAIVTMAIVVAWLQRSRIGKATRAVSDNPALASATGIDVERVISVVWTLGAGLAAFAGVYMGMTQDVYWNMGQRLLLVMFAAVVLGGLGTIYGALIGSLLVGLFIQLSTLVIPSEMKTVGALFVMIVILLIRPQGILGRRERVG